MEKIELILTNCIQEVRSGRSTPDQCLERYPAQRPELEPLLKMALNIQQPAAIDLDASSKRAAREQLLRQIRNAEPEKSNSLMSIFRSGITRKMVWSRLAAAVVIGIIVISLLSGGTVYAAQSSLPGELLYPVKTGTEEIRLWKAGDSVEKAELGLALAHTRLEEMNKLAASNSDKVGLAEKGYQINLQGTVSNVQNISDSAINTRIMERFVLALEEQISYCDQSADANQAYSLKIQEISNLAVNQQIEMLRSLAQRARLQAAHVNLKMMQNRLQRAQLKADEHQYQLMQLIILQYQQHNQLGLQILQKAQNSGDQSNEIDRLSASALLVYLRTLEAISQQVPQEYKGILQNSQQLTLQFQDQVHYQYQGGSDQGIGPNLPGGGSRPGDEQGLQGGSQPQEVTAGEGNGRPSSSLSPGGNAGGGTSSGPTATTSPTPSTGGSSSGTGSSGSTGTGSGSGSSSNSGGSTGSTGGGKH